MAYDDFRRAVKHWNINKFVKFYDRDEYAEAFRDAGEMYMRPIRSFAFDKSEQADDGRCDPYEALASEIMVESPGKPIFCCTAVGPSGLAAFLSSADGMRIIKEMAGPHGAAVIIDDPAEWLRRVGKAVPEGFRCGPISYKGDVFGVKEAMFHPGEKAFLKSSRFAYQHEFRVALNVDQPLMLEEAGIVDGVPVQRGRFDPRLLKIGPIADIARVMSADELTSFADVNRAMN